MAKTINYGNNKLDYKDFIANLSSNVDSYVNSHPEWSESQKALFKDEYTKLKNAMQESLDKDTDRFSIDEFGTITDKYGEFKNATDDDNLIDIADKFVGYEYSKIIEDIISTKSAEEQYAEMKYNGDMINYEQQLDNYNSCLTDINDTLEELENYLSDAKRINRNTIDNFVLKLRNLVNEYY